MYAILYKGLEDLHILVSVGVENAGTYLLQIPRPTSVKFWGVRSYAQIF